MLILAADVSSWESIRVWSDWLQRHLVGFYTLAGILTVVSIFGALIVAWIAVRQLRLQNDQTRLQNEQFELQRQESARVQAEADALRNKDLQLRAVDIAAWLLGDVGQSIARLDARIGSSGDSKLQGLLDGARRRVTSWEIDGLLASRGIAGEQEALALIGPFTQDLTQTLNMLELFSAKASVSHNKEVTYKYCAVYFCAAVEDYAPLIVILRRWRDGWFFSEGLALYEEWSAQLEADGRRAPAAAATSA